MVFYDNDSMVGISMFLLKHIYIYVYVYLLYYYELLIKNLQYSISDVLHGRQTHVVGVGKSPAFV